MYVALILSYAICFCSFHLYLSNFLSVCANWRVVCPLFLRILFALSSRYVLSFDAATTEFLLGGPYDYLSCIFTITMTSVPTQICSRGWTCLQKSHIFHPLKVMFCHWVELIQDAALNVFVVGEVWEVLSTRWGLCSFQ